MPLAVGAELLAEDRCARIALVQDTADRLLRGAIRFGDGRTVLLDLHRHLAETRQDLGARGIGGAFGESGERSEIGGGHRRAGYRRARAPASATSDASAALAIAPTSGSGASTAMASLSSPVT